MGNNNTTTINNKEFEILFYKVFKNLKLKEIILNYSRLFKKNEIVEFKDLKSLKDYREKEFINHLIYNSSEIINVGDLNLYNFNNLETFEFKDINYNKIIDGSIIPSNNCTNLKTIIFPKLNKTITKFKTFPKSVENFENLIIEDKPNGCIMGSNLFFPKHIKSVSFLNSFNCPDLSNGYFMTIFEKDSLESLSFNDSTRNLKEIYPFEKIIFFLPCSIKNLKVLNLNNTNLNSRYLPSSLINLTLGILNSNCLNDFNNQEINLPNNFKKFELIIQIPPSSPPTSSNSSTLINIPKNIDYLILRNINNYYKFIIPKPTSKFSSNSIQIEFHFNLELDDNIKLNILNETFSSCKKGYLKLLKITGLKNKKINIDEFY